MLPISNTYKTITFSLIGALLIVGTAWATKGSGNNDTWLYIFSIWMILFSAFEIYSSVPVSKISKWALTALIAAFAIILVVWWANGAEDLQIFLASTVGMVVAFFVLAPQRKQDNN